MTFYRALGDPPLDEVIEKINSENAKVDDADIEEIDQNDKTVVTIVSKTIISKACATLELKEVPPPIAGISSSNLEVVIY
ncbi:hypothetical protein VIGAN_03170600 [Vigna angularis var. angularis]|uniref:Uncharacterized protein n=1 Tax=Vigna angularis var. angularis TaxID=157739 RepID=A0A0S3RMN0_PHAAN|nr:hypothetical protein VIGAN_03170600 [Vigna angularis var. angularis]